MPTPKRFSEREIREVFERAAAQQQAAAQPSEGLTLAEMQEVAASAGIAPQFVTAAAQAVALGEPERGRTAVGPVPTGVYHTELLPGPPTDHAWARLVADLRRTFDAEGKVRVEGSVREWRNGNLRATLEPAGTGSSLSIRTRRDGAASGAVQFAVWAAVAVLAIVISLVGYGDVGAALGWAGLAAGLTMGAGGMWAGQRSWVRTREQQMDTLATRAGRDDSALASPPLAEPVGLAAPPLLGLDALSDLSTETASAPRRTRS